MESIVIILAVVSVFILPVCIMDIVAEKTRVGKYLMRKLLHLLGLE